MDKWKQVSRMDDFSIPTSKGFLSPSRLWALKNTQENLEFIDSALVGLKKELEKSSTESYLVTKTNSNTLLQLQFDITLDILQTKVAERDASMKAQETKAHNQKILALIESKKDEQLANMPLEELEKLMK